ncbi:AsmA family protein [mine drainage metagenome]|uniref:AsmA family protein n=1 Tax=mine drainage metagenome TaxID=410659 RepID=A0A1J5SDT8_9ZZZZ
MKWFKKTLLLIGLLLAIAVILPFFITLDDYIPQIEAAASKKLKEPVSIKSIAFSLLPTPHITIEGITLEKTKDLHIGKIVVTPDFISSRKASIIIKRIEIDALALPQQAIDKIPEWSKSEAPTPANQLPQIRLDSIVLTNAQVTSGKMSFGPFDAHVNLNSESKLKDASITTLDNKLKILAEPDQSNYRIDINAKKWTLPIGPKIVFDELSIKGIATLQDANFNEINATLYGGTAKGKMSVDWQKGLQINGNLDIHKVEMQKIASMLSSSTHVSGLLNAKPVFSASATSAGQLMSALHLETLFNVQNGVLYGVDIKKAATNLVKKETTGGETRFDELSGHLVMAHSGYDFTQLKISADTLGVDGDVNISDKKELSGRINAQVKALGVSTQVPLNVTGTIDSPMLYPTGGTITGAVVGTAIMGPGVGTSVGAKVGGWVENMFGKKK